MRRLTLAITFVLVLMGSVMAQSASRTPADLWGDFSLSYQKANGVEASSGTLDYVDEICWGRTFSMVNENGTLTVAPNYHFNARGSNEPEEYSKIAGGAWTMVYRSRRTNGMLFGEMTGGTIEWHRDKSGTLLYGNIEADLNIKGGTDSFMNVGGPATYGKFIGTVYYDKKGVPTIVGTADLMF